MIPGIGGSANQFEMTVERDVPVKMRDGIILYADIHWPKAEGRFPQLLLQRTPYGKTARWIPQSIRL